jgi:putative methionine-R-sulfoxide reductase with GAF domain
VTFIKYEFAEKKIMEIISKEKTINIPDKIVEFLFETFEKYDWIGIYLVSGKELILGPWRGKQATEHVKIPIGEGICGSAAKSGKTEIISNVNLDDRYLSCFTSTKSEIVIPIKKNGNVIGEIDIDSNTINAFSEQDSIFLEKIADMLSPHIC